MSMFSFFIASKKDPSLDAYLEALDNMSNELEKDLQQMQDNKIKKHKIVSKQQIDKINHLDKAITDNKMNQNLKPLKMNNYSNELKQQQDTFMDIIFTSLKKEAKSLRRKNCLEDNAWAGIFVVLKTKHNNQITKERIIPIGEILFRYSQAVIFLLCCNANANALSIKKIGFGVRFLCLSFGYGDGFYRSYLHEKIIRKTWELFQIKSIFSDFYQFCKPSYNIGLIINYLNNVFISITWNTNSFRSAVKHKHGIGINIHGIFPKIFLALYIVLMKFISLDIGFLEESLFISCIHSDKIKQFFFSLNIFKFISILSEIKQFFNLINRYIVVLINYNYLKNTGYSLIFSMIIKLGGFQLIISYEKELKFILTVKHSESMSLINWMRENEAQLAY